MDEWADHWLGLVRQTMPANALKWEREWEDASWDTDTMPPERGVLVGPTEVADLLGVKVTTVYQWVHRSLLPEPWDTVSGTRLWARSVIEDWARETGRLLEPVPPEPF